MTPSFTTLGEQRELEHLADMIKYYMVDKFNNEKSKTNFILKCFGVVRREYSKDLKSVAIEMTERIETLDTELDEMIVERDSLIEERDELKRDKEVLEKEINILNEISKISTSHSILNRYTIFIF